MRLQSVYDGEGFRKSPAQFIEIVSNWASQNRTKDLTAFIEQLHRHSIDDQALMLVGWIDSQTTTHQRDSCIQFVMDAIHSEECNDDGFGDDSDIYYDEMGYGHEV